MQGTLWYIEPDQRLLLRDGIQKWLTSPRSRRAT
jgi:hypothetical protein